MSTRTYYIRRDGSATPNKPWSGDHITTVRAHSAYGAERKMAYLDPKDVYARFYIFSKRCCIEICDLEALRSQGMNDRLFLSQGKWTNYGIEVIGVPLENLGEEIVRIAETIVKNLGKDVRIDLLHDGSAYYSYHQRMEVPIEEPTWARTKQMARLQRYLMKRLSSPMITILPPSACHLEIPSVA